MIAHTQGLWHRLSLVGRLIAVLLTCSCVASAVLLEQQVSTDARENLAALRRQAIEEMDSLAPQIGDQALIGDYTAIQQILDRFANHANVVEVEWADPKGARVTAMGAAQKAGAPEFFRHWLDIGAIHAQRPVVIGGREYGKASLRLGPTALEAHLWRSLVNGALILAVAWLVQAMVITLILRTTVGSLTELDQSARRVEDGDLKQRLVPSGPPELRRLMKAFNRMAESLERAQAELLSSLHQSEAAHRELARFSEILAHHLQEPVRRLAIFAQRLTARLAGKCDDADAATSLAFIDQEARRLRSLVRDMELYLAAEKPQGAIACQQTEAVVKEVVRLHRAALDEVQGEVEVASLPTVVMDRRRLEEVVAITLDNAIRYRSPHRPLRVRISGAAETGRVQLRIEDNGLGIPQEYRERVFRVFERLQAGGDATSTGIGLAILRRIAESTGGKAWIEESAGGGVAVMVELDLGSVV